ALGRAPHPVIWGSKNSWPVQIIFLLAVPATDAAQYLHLLATLAHLGQQPERLMELRLASTAEELSAVLEKVPMGNG
ncbi:MAG: PTS sugar transporter subunit IIA, partial [Limisphaerales bacterium]